MSVLHDAARTAMRWEQPVTGSGYTNYSLRPEHGGLYSPAHMARCAVAPRPVPGRHRSER
eukprot:6873167-Prymnesium_polylepis.1